MQKLIEQQFVATYFNYARPDFDAPPLPRIDGPRASYDTSIPDGLGKGQVCFYICDPKGRIIHRLDGFVRPATLLEEARWALNTLAQEERDRRHLGRAVAQRIRRLEAKKADAAGDELLRIRYQMECLEELSGRYLLQRPDAYLLRLLAVTGD